MIKRLLTILFILVTFSLKAQLTLNNVNPQYYTPDSTESIEAHMEVINNNNDSIDVNVIRTIEAFTPGHEELFCFGLYCYLPNTDTSQYPTTIQAGATETTFKPVVNPYGINGYDRLHYRFYDVNNISDSVTVTLEFFFNVAVGLTEHKNDSYIKFKNEVNNFTVFNYKLPSEIRNARIDIHNMLGSRLTSVNLSQNQGMKIMSTSGYNNGIYLVSLVINNRVSQTYRMIVNHTSGN